VLPRRRYDVKAGVLFELEEFYVILARVAVAPDGKWSALVVWSSAYHKLKMYCVSSGCAERVFSWWNHFLTSCQQTMLADAMEAAVVVGYNGRTGRFLRGMSFVP
jgi:hypothetical protein